MASDKATRFPWEPEGERIVLETPELTAVEYRIAPFGTRIAAALLDRILIAAVCGVVFLTASIIFFSQQGSTRYALYFYAFTVAFWFLFSLFYFVIAEARGSGRTWGKRRMGIRTIMGSGQGPTLGASLVRNIARIVDDWPVLWILPALSKGHRRLGDYLADTLVIVDSERAAPAPSASSELAPSYRDLAEKKFHFPPGVAAKLYPDDLNLLEHMEGRLARSREPERIRAIRSVASRYVDRLGLDEERSLVEEDPGRFLEEMKLFLRERFEREAY